MSEHFLLRQFVAAQKRIYAYLQPSPLLKSQWLSKELQADVYLKLECLQPGRSFKIRGALNALLSQSTLPRGVITASGGNHGLGVAIAAQYLNVPCKVVLPLSTSEYRVGLLKNIGAEVEIYGNSYDDANIHAKTMANLPETLYIHAFADREVMQGQGTIALELDEQLGDFDVLIASVGGGGLLNGISRGLFALGKTSQMQIYAVETLGADSLAQSYRNKTLVELPAITSIAKTLGARMTTQEILNSLSELISDCWVVEDRDAVQSLLDFLDQEKLLVEPATSCVVASALQHKDLLEGKKIVMVICGSNVSWAEVELWKQHFLGNSQ